MLHTLVGIWLTISAIAGTENIFGPDDRKAITSTEYPWTAIGKVDGCTGTLISKNLVITAAHCVLENGKLRQVGDFYPNAIGNRARASSAVTHVWWGTNDPDGHREDDWAILKLKENLGDTFGWMGVDAGQRMYVHLAGYSADFEGGRTAGVHLNCQFKDVSAEYWLHDCDMTRGASGGPMFYTQDGKPFIAAINVAERRGDGEESLKVKGYDSAYANLAVPAKKFVAKVKELRAMP